MNPQTITIFQALMPICLLIGLGYYLRRQNFPGDGFWPALEKLTYFLLFPALLVNRLANADLAGLQPGALTVAALLSWMPVAALLWWSRNRIADNPSAFSSVFQGGVRFNTYVGFAAAQALFPGTGITVAALVAAILIPLVNVQSVWVLTRTAKDAKNLRLWPSLASNPLILGCLLGIGLNISGLGLPLPVSETLGLLGKAALPLGLLAVGAALHLEKFRHRWRELGVSIFTKLFALPAWAGFISISIGLEQTQAAVLILFAALPGATSSYILARQLGGDAPLMAVIITVQTFAAAITLPVVLLLVL